VGPGAGAWEATAEQKGTSNQVSGAAPRSSINVVSAEQDLEKTDLATFAFGMIAGTYTIANVLLTVAGALMMVLKAHLYAGTRVDLDEGCLGSVQRRRSA
jgi:hypothetical protein